MKVNEPLIDIFLFKSCNIQILKSSIIFICIKLYFIEQIVLKVESSSLKPSTCIMKSFPFNKFLFLTNGREILYRFLHRILDFKIPIQIALLLSLIYNICFAFHKLLIRLSRFSSSSFQTF